MRAWVLWGGGSGCLCRACSSSTLAAAEGHPRFRAHFGQLEPSLAAGIREWKS